MDLSAFMAVAVSATALILAVQVYSKPKIVVFVGPLFLMAAHVFLPARARFVD
jgi:hypothetical protein